jgi:hypothetical protein
MQALETDLARAALHETAHATVGILMGLRVMRACLRPNARVEYLPATDSFDLTLPVAALAGIIAEIIAGADSGRRWQLAHSNDVLTSRLTIDKCRAAGCKCGWRLLRGLAYSAVISNWHSILRVGACLLAVNELSGAEIAALCVTHMQGANT